MKTTVTPEVVRAEKPDVLVLAAGAAHTRLDLPGADSPKLIKTEKLHGQIKLALKFFSARRLERLTRLWMPVGKSVVIMGGKLHGCELAEFLVKRGRQVVIAHDGPASELGEGMTKDDLENLWPWFKLKQVPIWSEAEYREIVDRGLKIQVPDKRVFVLEGKSVMTTQDWGPNTRVIEELGGLAERDSRDRELQGARLDRGCHPRGRSRRLFHLRSRRSVTRLSRVLRSPGAEISRSIQARIVPDVPSVMKFLHPLQHGPGSRSR